MGWLFSIVLFFAGCAMRDGLMLIASGIFAIAGAISFNSIKK